MEGRVKIAAVLVVYEQVISETETYRTLLKNTNIPYLVYDNSLNEQVVEGENMSYVHNPNNPGVSKAYNEAINWAKKIKASHLLLLDSDSVFPDFAFEQYEAAILTFPNRLILPSLVSENRKISPFYFSNGKTHYGGSIEEGQMQLGEKLAINAGSLLPINALGNIRFNETLPLDWSDVYFFRRLSKTSIQAQHIALQINHGLSEHQQKNLESAKLRFDLYLRGIPEVSEGSRERLLMYFWAKLKAIKLALHYKSLWFPTQYLKRLYE